MAPTSHRPRKKRRDDQVSGPRSNALIVTDAETKQQKPAFPLVTMDCDAAHPYGCGTLQMGYWLLGLFWLVHDLMHNHKF